MRYVFFSLCLVIVGFVAWALTSHSLTRTFFAPTESTVPAGMTRADVSEATTTTLATRLSTPWDVAFLPDGSMLITERTGTLAHLEEDTIARLSVPGVTETGEGGLLGIVLHPDFSENRYVYLYMTHQSGVGTQNRVIRYVYENNTLQDATTIIDGIPGASYHDGGRIAFGPDGMLYVTTGDAGNEKSAQDTRALSGKILRLYDDGSVPGDNPFENAVYSYGHRNPQGLAWDEEGQLWSVEHGRSGLRSGFDELNRIEMGGNYGWPVIQGDETREGMITPVLHSGPDTTWAPASLVYRDGSFFWGGLRGQSLYEATRDGETAANLVAHFREEYGRIRTVTFGPDGRLYFTTSNTDGRGKTREYDDVLISVDPVLFE